MPKTGFTINNDIDNPIKINPPAEKRDWSDSKEDLHKGKAKKGKESYGKCAKRPFVHHSRLEPSSYREDEEEVISRRKRKRHRRRSRDSSEDHKYHESNSR